MAGVGGCALAWPLVASLAPPASLEPDPVLRVGTADIAPGTQRLVRWRGLPVAVIRRSGAEIAALSAPAHLASLLDPSSRATQQPDFAANPTRSADPAIGVLIGVCTHLGCVPNFRPGDVDTAYLCPCHGSRFDLAGRVLKGSPARLNLAVPPYRPAADAVLIGDRSLDPGFGIGRLEAI